jgi:hypothetical protein
MTDGPENTPESDLTVGPGTAYADIAWLFGDLSREQRQRVRDFLQVVLKHPKPGATELAEAAASVGLPKALALYLVERPGAMQLLLDQVDVAIDIHDGAP